METQKQMLTVETNVAAPIEKVWDYWTKPEHITQWNSASPDWHSPTATNDLRAGGSFSCRMEAKDGSMGFDFGGIYDEVTPHQQITYTLGDGRKVDIKFTAEGQGTRVVENFEAEATNSLEMQQGGWQAIMDNFKKYTEAN
ncbi:MAG: SRPBCC family protein [Ferruginibacter sp.]|nr:SRPBCC family protein [Ferruginibacter sp.]